MALQGSRTRPLRLNRSQLNNCSEKLSTDKNLHYKHPHSDLQIWKNFMNSKVARGRSLKTMFAGTE